MEKSVETIHFIMNEFQKFTVDMTDDVAYLQS